MVLKNTCQIQLDIDSIDYDKLDRFVSSKLSGPAKWWVHGVFFQKVRSINSRSSASANREFADGANWAKSHILKAANQEAARFGIKANSIRFDVYDGKVRITLHVSGVENALNGALSDLGIRLSGVTLQA